MKTALFFSRRRQGGRSSALLITLLMLSLITVIAVAFLGTMTWEMSAARNNYENLKARALAMLGMNTAVAQLRMALDTWDNPYSNFATNPPAFFWSTSPGIITRWSYTSTTSLTNYPLFSLDPSGANNLFNLNALQSDGTYPIAGITNTTVAGATAPNISVYWTPVLKNPGQPASSSNPIIGRYAFWVDDENAKININTADGTLKYTTNSLGLGSPSEVSLQALQEGGSSLTTPTATNIVYLARTAGFNSVREILRAAGTTPDLYTNNVFNITAYSRSPDINIFGQPKMVLTPLLGTSGYPESDMTLNSMTLQPAREIYPTPSQLPPYSVPGASGPMPYPLAFRGSDEEYNSGLANGGIGFLSSGGVGNDQGNYVSFNGMMLANYLAGTNAANQAITWPAFPGSSTTGFTGKYTPRQIDSIVAQIASLGAKDISPDYPFATNPPLSNRGLRAVTTPLLAQGWLSQQWVSGMGRTPKVDSIELKFVTYGATGLPTDTKNYFPSASLDIWLEWWLPAAYLGGENDIPVASGQGQLSLGFAGANRALNVVDISASSTNSPVLPAPLPRADYVTANYWGNQLLTNDQGIDFQCNPNSTKDPDQTMAAHYHHPYALEPDGVTYAGTGYLINYAQPLNAPFFMDSPQTNSSGSSSWKDWQPGELRCVQSFNGSLAIPPMPMQTNTANPMLDISGGIQVLSQFVNSSATDPDPVPLEAVRGPVQIVGQDGENWTDPATPGNSQKLRDRFMQEVIPMPTGFSVTIPTPNGAPSGITKYVLIKVADPLVNKLPGDWTTAGGATVTVSDGPPPTAPSYWANETNNMYSTNSEYDSSSGSSFHALLTDADSYWIPQADCPICSLNDIAGETLIPRSARCPNIGYLQYIRTGIMPDVDNPSQPGLEHGTPFRLLSYAPLTDTANQKTTAPASAPYPDWAMLDLLYIPSTLAAYGNPYGYYDTNTPPVWRGYGNAGVLASFSTGGGSTPGRINPNGTVIYTTNTTTPQPGVSRTLPMQALLHGLMVKQTLNSTNASPTPGFTGGAAVDDAGIAQAVYTYISANGPLRMPGELCNVPEIAALRPSVNPTRNDLIRQIMGNLTTQSNTFSIWVAGESISKSKANNNPANQGIYEPGDPISASVRYHFIVERYLDPGADGVYGNSVNSGADGISGTYDDPVDPINHPFQPRYLYRVVALEEIR